MLDEMLLVKYPNEDSKKISMYKILALNLCRQYFENTLNITISDEELEEEYTGALLLLISNSIDFEDSKGLTSISQGNKSKSFNPYVNKQFMLTDEIKAFFPLPVVKFEG